MKQRLNEIQKAFISIERSAPGWIFPTPLINMIAEYVRTLLDPWKDLLEHRLSAFQIQNEVMDLDEIKYFNENFFHVLSSLDQSKNKFHCLENL